MTKITSSIQPDARNSGYSLSVLVEGLSLLDAERLSALFIEKVASLISAEEQEQGSVKPMAIYVRRYWGPNDRYIAAISVLQDVTVPNTNLRDCKTIIDELAAGGGGYTLMVNPDSPSFPDLGVYFDWERV